MVTDAVLPAAKASATPAPTRSLVVPVYRNAENIAALLDAARRPAWAWALTGRDRAMWIGGICLGILSVVGGLLVSGIYLVRIRPAVAAAEHGDLSRL